MLCKYRKRILLFIILAGFGLRFYSAILAPVNYDEWNDLKVARKISFDLKNPNLPLIDVRENNNCPMSFYYIVKLGLYAFGDFLFGARLPFVILGTIMILLVYFFVKPVLGVKTALLSSLLLSISQFAISISRFFDLGVIVMLISALSIFLFHRALVNNNRSLLLLNGLIVGIGFWFRESMCLLIPIYIIFLLSCREYRSWLKNKYVWISFGIAFCVMLPRIYLILSPGATRIRYICNTVHTGISMGPFALYLGELVLFIFKPFPGLFNHLADTVNVDYMFTNFVVGILVFMAVIFSFKSRNNFIKLLLVCFISEFIFYSFIRSGNPDWGIFNFESFYYSIMGFIPAIILVASMVVNFFKNYKFQGSLFLLVLVIFMVIRACIFVTFPLNYFSPAKDFCIEELLNCKGRSFRFEDNMPSDIEEDILKRVYKVTGSRLVYKERSALQLAELLIQEDRIKESRKYLYYVLSQNPANRDALRLLGGQ